jgi:hypothetical protein
MKRRFFLALAFLLVFAQPGAARANCANPTDVEGKIMYNTTYHVPQFCDGTTWRSLAGGGGGGTINLLSSQTASNSASLQFTNLPTSYNTLYLNCAGLKVSVTAAAISVYIGEGAGPTWKTTANYNSVYSQVMTGGTPGSITNGDSLWGSDSNPTTFPFSLKMTIDNVGSSTLYKLASFTAAQEANWNSNALIAYTGSAYWANDTNPITGIELVPSSGNIPSGTCSLYGMN